MKSSVLSALANPVRIKLLTCPTKKPKNVSFLINNCGLSQSAVSQHLEKLRLAGLVTTTREGKEIYYGLVNKKTAKISYLLLKFLEEEK